MDEGSILSGLIIAVLIFFAAYFALCETAFASVGKIKLRADAERGDTRAVRALKIAEDFDRAITTILIGTNITHMVVAAYVTVLVQRRWGAGAVAVGTLVTTAVLFLIGEMLPKSIGKRYSEAISLSTAGSLCFFMRIFAPIAFILTKIGSAVAGLAGEHGELTVTEDELHDFIETMADDGNLDDERGELINSAFDFGEVTVESIITARVDIVALDIDTPRDEVLSFIKEQKHSRIPVYEGSIDNIVGVLLIRKYIKAYLAGQKDLDIRSLMDKVYYVHQSTYIDELLGYMSQKKINMVVVSDNYGGTLGIATVEDILEELVGEIWDEDDEVVETCIACPDGSWLFDAAVSVEEAFEFMEYEDPDDFDFEHKLLGEWAYEELDLMPRPGDSFDYNGLKMTVTKVDNRRVVQLRAEKIHEEGGEEQ